MERRIHILVALACCALIFLGGCVTSATKKATGPQPGQRALVLFKTTHHDRAGETGTVIRRTGEFVTISSDGWAVIATAEGDIIRCPQKALHAVTPEIVAVLATRKHGSTEYVAAEELERWFPAQTVPFTLRWLPPEDIARVLRESKANP